MKSKLLYDGGNLFADILSSSARINGIYVLYSATELSSIPSNLTDFVQHITSQPDSGYARIPITGRTRANNTIVYSGLLTSSDLVGSPVVKGTRLTMGILCNLGNTADTDMFLYAAMLRKPVAPTKGAYITINIPLKLEFGEI